MYIKINMVIKMIFLRVLLQLKLSPFGQTSVPLQNYNMGIMDHENKGGNCIGVTSPQIMCPCSKAIENIEQIKEHGEYLGKVGGDYIIDGSVVDRDHKRPWIAMVLTANAKMRKLIKNDGMSTCGGAVINKRYVLTASHCLCKGQHHPLFPCSENEKDAGKLLYDPSKMILVMLGINDKETSGENFEGTDHIYRVEDVKQNPFYRNSKAPNDYALIKLDRDIQFIRNFIEPISLPSGQGNIDLELAEKSILSNRVYIAGWGRIKTSNEFCTTDKNGPVKYSKCNYNPKKVKRPQCFIEDTPALNNAICKHFKDTQGDNLYPQKPKESIRIVDLKTGEDVFCFSKYKGPYGWCKTIIRGENDDNWGWCDPISCNTSRIYSVGRKLLEVRVMMITKQDCKFLEKWNRNNFGISQEYNSDIELCAGRMENFTKVDTYIKEGENYEHPRNIKSHDKFGLRKKGYKLNYYLGGKDNCLGDSGGPLYTWIKGHPTLIGIISRGTGLNHEDDEHHNGCGEYNFPGIYTRVNKILMWIKKNAEDGNCS